MYVILYCTIFLTKVYETSTANFISPENYSSKTSYWKFRVMSNLHRYLGSKSVIRYRVAVKMFSINLNRFVRQSTVSFRF